MRRVAYLHYDILLAMVSRCSTGYRKVTNSRKVIETTLRLCGVGLSKEWTNGDSSSVWGSSASQKYRFLGVLDPPGNYFGPWGYRGVGIYCIFHCRSPRDFQCVIVSRASYTTDTADPIPGVYCSCASDRSGPRMPSCSVHESVSVVIFGNAGRFCVWCDNTGPSMVSIQVRC